MTSFFSGMEALIRSSTQLYLSVDQPIMIRRRFDDRELGFRRSRVKYCKDVMSTFNYSPLDMFLIYMLSGLRF